jgi:hypothetical protein
MSINLLRYATEFRRNNDIVPFEELVNSAPLLGEHGTIFFTGEGGQLGPGRKFSKNFSGCT